MQPKDVSKLHRAAGQSSQLAVFKPESELFKESKEHILKEHKKPQKTVIPSPHLLSVPLSLLFPTLLCREKLENEL